jgi:hypothetical protein
LVVVLCGAAGIASAAPRSARRDDARKVLQAQNCGSCHDSAVSTEHPGALAVYDLHEADWPAKMSDQRLPKLMTRLRSAPAADRAVVKRFIEAELLARADQRRSP